jgi:hypothetical protein
VAVDAWDPVRRVWSRRGCESRVGQVKALPERRHCGWDIKVLACQGVHQPTARTGRVQLDHRDREDAVELRPLRVGKPCVVASQYHVVDNAGLGSERVIPDDLSGLDVYHPASARRAARHNRRP